MPKGYVFGEVEVTDPALYDTYRPMAAAAVAAFGGRYLVRGGGVAALEGDGPIHRTVLLEFDSPERAQEWYRSEQYRPALAIRHKAARSRMLLLNGHDLV